MTPTSRAPADDLVVPAAPRLAALWATITYAMCALVLGWPALAGRTLLNPHSDQYIAGFPFRDFASQSLKAGQGMPLWNPYLFGGLPYVGAMHGDMFYPTALLRLLLGTGAGMTWGFILHIFLAGCFTYGFLRAWRLGFYPALVGGIAYMMGGPLAGLVSPGHDGKLFVSALMPFALWMLLRGMRDARPWAWGLLSLSVGLAVLSPHPQLLQYMLLTLGAFGLFLAFATGEDGTRLPRPVAIRRLGYALGAVALGFLIGAIQYMPALEFVPFSPRAGGKGYDYATSYSLPLEEVFNFYLPQFSGLHDLYWGRNGIHLHSEYIGASVLLLASACVGGASRRGFRRFWLGTLVVSLLWALGGTTPFYQLIYAIVPGTKFFRAPSTMLMVVGFSMAVLAALGTERLLERRVSRRLAFGWLAAGGVIALLATVGVLTGMAQSIGANFFGGRLYDRIAEGQGALTIGGWRSFLAVAAIVAVALAYERRRLSATALAWTLAAVVAVDLWSVERSYWLFSAPAQELYASDPAADYLRTAPTGRVVAAQLSEQGAAFHDPNLDGDGLMVHRIRLATGYHGNEVGRYRRLGSPDGSEQYANALNPVFWRLANVRYLYTNADVPAAQGLTKLVGPVRDAAGSTIYLYRLPGDNPPAWVVPVLVKAPEDPAQSTVLDPRFDPLRAGLVDTSSRIGVSSISALPEPVAVTANVTRYDPGHITLQLAGSAPAGSALIVSENWYPGWTATVDGHAVETVRADLSLIGVPLSAGAHQVQLDFTDPAYPRGKLVTILATLLAAGLAAAGALVERRRRAA